MPQVEPVSRGLGYIIQQIRTRGAWSNFATQLHSSTTAAQPAHTHSTAATLPAHANLQHRSRRLGGIDSGIPESTSCAGRTRTHAFASYAW